MGMSTSTCARHCEGGMILFEEWGAMEWVILAVDIIALVVVIGFLKWKIQRKLNEVEIRQRHHLHLKRPSAQSSEQETSED